MNGIFHCPRLTSADLGCSSINDVTVVVFQVVSAIVGKGLRINKLMTQRTWHFIRTGEVAAGGI